MNLRAWPRLKSWRELTELPISRMPFLAFQLVLEAARMGTSISGSWSAWTAVTMPWARAWSLAVVSLSRLVALGDLGRVVTLFLVVVFLVTFFLETFLTTFFLVIFLAMI